MQFVIGKRLADVSFYQDDNTTPQKIDFAKMKANGISNVIIRGGQNTWEDPDFADYWHDAKAAGLNRGTYYLFDSRADPVAQAAVWKNAIAGDLPELGLWVDLEESYGGAFKGEKNWKLFINTVMTQFPTLLVGIYTANWWWSQQTVTDPAFFGQFPLWVAGYTISPTNVVLPKPWTKAVLWQYTSKGDGLLYGVESLNIDLDYFNGTDAEFDAFFGLTPPSPIDIVFEPFDLHYRLNGVEKTQRYIPE